NPKPETLNPQPSTLNPQPSTLNPQPSTLNPQPSTTPSTTRPPCTPNPKPTPTLSPRNPNPFFLRLLSRCGTRTSARLSARVLNRAPASSSCRSPQHPAPCTPTRELHHSVDYAWFTAPTLCVTLTPHPSTNPYSV
ncbi:hypothetical protein T484DRAFT_3645344, partial [Baffinella frigidus]